MFGLDLKILTLPHKLPVTVGKKLTNYFTVGTLLDTQVSSLEDAIKDTICFGANGLHAPILPKQQPARQAYF